MEWNTSTCAFFILFFLCSELSSKYLSDAQESFFMFFRLLNEEWQLRIYISDWKKSHRRKSCAAYRSRCHRCLESIHYCLMKNFSYYFTWKKIKKIRCVQFYRRKTVHNLNHLFCSALQSRISNSNFANFSVKISFHHFGLFHYSGLFHHCVFSRVRYFDSA